MDLRDFAFQALRDLWDKGLGWLLAGGGLIAVLGTWIAKRKAHAEARAVEAQADISISREYRDLVDRLERRIEILEGKIQAYEAENRRLAEENAQLRVRVKELEKKLLELSGEVRHPK